MNINHLPNLNRELRKVLRAHHAQSFPIVIYFNQGMEHPQFKITVEKAEIDSFTDATGQKWKKVK